MRRGALTTVVGAGLFDFGHRDGDAAQALLQHPLGVCALPDDSVIVLDTYNDAVRRYDPAGSVTTIVIRLREPADAVVDGDTLVVVEFAAHRLTRVPLSGRIDVPASAAASCDVAAAAEFPACHVHGRIGASPSE